MNVRLAREPFLRALQLVQTIVESRQTLPILSNVLLETQESGLRLLATDLEVGVRVTLPAAVKTPGAITLGARKLLEIVRELQAAEEVTLASRENSGVELQSGRARFKLVGLPADEFPPLALDSAGAGIPVDGARLRAMLTRTAFAMSQDESRPFLNGIFLTLKQRDLRFVATDGHRLALTKTEVDSGEEMSGIVPRKAVQELGRVLGSADQVALAVRDSQFFVRTQGFELASKLVEGAFPAYEQVLPKAHPRRLVVERELLIAGLRRVSVVADDRTKPVTMVAGAALEDGGRGLRLKALSQELGDAAEELPAEFAGEELAIGFNARYLLEALAPMEGERVVIELKDALSPGVVKSLGDEQNLCVIMPMRI
jgi:DNA polymerase-3 subunit beta